MTKIMIVDDSSTMRNIVARLVRRTEFQLGEVLEASNGVEALQRLVEFPEIRLILSDVHMPEMNGIELVRKLRETEPSLPVVMIARDGADAMLERAMESGANGFVRKPFSSETLRIALEPFLA